MHPHTPGKASPSSPSLPAAPAARPQAFASGRYARDGERGALLEHLSAAASTPQAPWPSGSSFSFRNSLRIYGSPQLDAVLASGGSSGGLVSGGANGAAAGAQQGGGAGIAALVQELRAAF